MTAQIPKFFYQFGFLRVSAAPLSSWRGQFSAEAVLPPLSAAELHLAFCPAEADELLSAVLTFSVHRHFFFHLAKRVLAASTGLEEEPKHLLWLLHRWRSTKS